MPAKPLHPRLVLLASLIPGAGHVVQARPQRGLVFLFFIVILGWISLRLMPEGASVIGRHIGGIFIYGISVLDAYRFSRIEWEKCKHAQND